MVAHLDQHPLVTGFSFNLYLGNAFARRLSIATCVFQQVGNHTGQFNRVSQNIDVLRNVDSHPHVVVVSHRINRGGHDFIEGHAFKPGGLGSGVFKELVNDGVKLRNVGRHVLAGVEVGHAQLGFQAQARQRGAQIVRNARQHDDPVLLYF